jgi:hypothetical protein
MSFGVAEAFIQFGITPGSLEAVENKAKSTLAKLSKEKANIGLDAKNVGAGLSEAFSGVKEKLGGIVGSAMKGADLGGFFGELTSGITSLAPMFGEILAIPFLGEIAAGVAAMIATIPAGISRETHLTRLGIQTGSPGRAKALASGLHETFTGSGVEAPERVAAEMASKGKSPEEIVAQMKKLGNISLGTGDNLEGMADAMARVEITGRVTSRTLWSMKGVTEQLARDYGVGTERIKEMADQGLVRIPQLQRAIDKLGGAGGHYGQAMKTMQNTTAGQWEALTSQFSRLAGDIGTSLMGGLKEFFAGIASAVGFVRELLGAIGDLVPLAGVWSDIVIGIWEAFKGIFDMLTAIVHKIREAIKRAEELAYWLSFGIIGKKPGTKEEAADKSMEVPKDTSGVGHRFEFHGIADLATSMQERAGELASNVPKQQLDVLKQIADNTSPSGGQPAAEGGTW